MTEIATLGDILDALPPVGEATVAPLKPRAVLVRGMPISEYHAPDRPGVSASKLKKLVPPSTPRHFWWDFLRPKDEDEDDNESDSLRLGRLFHVLCLEPHLLNDGFYVTPKITRRGEAWERVMADAGTRDIVWNEEVTEYQKIAQYMIDFPAAQAILERDGLVEASIFWTDEETGVQCRARPDWLIDEAVPCNLKSAASAAPHDGPGGFFRDAYSRGYHVGAAMEMEAVKALTGDYPEDYFLIVQEKSAPYCTLVLNCADDPAGMAFLEKGYRDLRAALALYAKCMKENHWPAYSDDIVSMRLPGYIRTED